jgi:pyruvate/2-oxoglutarate dehydrogenase complex dihydrolipoamide dehydrogenase (E3) component
MSEFHTAVIGAGSAGLTVTVGLANLGKKVALIERKYVGGDCTNVGCIPSKTLIHLVKDKQLAKEDILAKVRQRRDHLRDEETEWIKNYKNVSFFEAEAQFIDKETLELSTGQRIKAKHIVIATGSEPIRISIDGLDQDKILTNETLFDLHHPPEYLAILGGGIIGSEMAFAFRKLGCKVTLIDNGDRVLKVLEPEVSVLIEKRMKDEGIEVITHGNTLRYDSNQCGLIVKQGDKELSIRADKVLMAIGRRANLESLRLEQAGVMTDKRGIPTNNAAQSNIPNIYAIGDVNHRSAFTHSANAQGRKLVQNITFPFLPVKADPIYPSAVFTDPEIAQVGPTLEKLKTKFHPNLIKTYRFELSKTDRGYTQNLQEGFILIHAMQLTGRVLSATIVAPNASEMLSLLTYAVNQGVSLYKLSSLVFPYPVMSEAIKKIADQFVFATLPKLPKELTHYLSHRFTFSSKDLT